VLSVLPVCVRGTRRVPCGECAQPDTSWPFFRLGGWELIVAGTATLAVAPTPQQGKCQQDVFLASNPNHFLHAHDCALIVVRA
jgi:hypothetical protein